MASWEMASCGKCRRCLSGVPSHGPYLLYHEYRSKDDRPHKYGGKGSSGAGGTAISLKGQDGPDGYAEATLDRAREEERERVRAKADAEYERRKARLTPAQSGKIETIVGLAGRLRTVQRRQRRETDRRIGQAEREHATPRSGGSGGSAPPGLLSRAAAHIKAEVAQQYAHEIKELKKQIAEQKKELAEMLKA